MIKKKYNIHNVTTKEGPELNPGGYPDLWSGRFVQGSEQG